MIIELSNIYTLEWFFSNLCLDGVFPKGEVPLEFFKASELKAHKKEFKKKRGVYAIYSITERKYYVGSSVDLRSRLLQHLNHKTDSERSRGPDAHEYPVPLISQNTVLASSGFSDVEVKYHTNKNLRNALIENGIDDFYILILALVEPSQNDLLNLSSKELNKKLYQELLDIEDKFLQIIPKHKLYNIALNSINTSGLTHRHSIEARIKMSLKAMGNTNGQGNKGYQHSLETKHNMSVAKKGNKNAAGAIRSDETREKMRLAQQARRNRDKNKP